MAITTTGDFGVRAPLGSVTSLPRSQSTQTGANRCRRVHTEHQRLTHPSGDYRFGPLSASLSVPPELFEFGAAGRARVPLTCHYQQN